MNLTPKIGQALEVAATAHRTQKRKGSSLPYIIHPVAVAMIASSVTDDEDTLCACLLHDVLEDRPGEYGASQMNQDFGQTVLDIVQTVTKDTSVKGWRKRNEAYLETIRSTSSDAALIVCAADKLHNLSAVIRDYRQLGDGLWARFHAGKDDQIWWYRSALKVLQDRLPDNPLTTQLAELVAELEKLTR